MGGCATSALCGYASTIAPPVRPQIVTNLRPLRGKRVPCRTENTSNSGIGNTKQQTFLLRASSCGIPTGRLRAPWAGVAPGVPDCFDKFFLTARRALEYGPRRAGRPVSRSREVWSAVGPGCIRRAFLTVWCACGSTATPPHTPPSDGGHTCETTQPQAFRSGNPHAGGPSRERWPRRTRCAEMLCRARPGGGDTVNAGRVCRGLVIRRCERCGRNLAGSHRGGRRHQRVG